MRKRLSRTPKTLQVKLTPDEVLDRASQLAGAVQDLAILEARERAFVERIRRRTLKLQQDQTRLAEILLSGTEPRKVVVALWADFGTGRAMEEREDTGETIAERPLTPAERQGRLFETPEETDPPCSH